MAAIDGCDMSVGSGAGVVDAPGARRILLHLAATLTGVNSSGAEVPAQQNCSCAQYRPEPRQRCPSEAPRCAPNCWSRPAVARMAIAGEAPRDGKRSASIGISQPRARNGKAGGWPSAAPSTVTRVTLAILRSSPSNCASAHRLSAMTTLASTGPPLRDPGPGKDSIKANGVPCGLRCSAPGLPRCFCR